MRHSRNIMGLRRILLSFIFACGVIECAPPPKQVQEENVRAKIAQTPFRLTKSMGLFNEKMYRKLSELDEGNIVYSPFSLHTALSLAYLGAPVGSETSEELINLLSLDPHHTEDYLYNYLRVLQTQQELSEKLNTSLTLANKMFVTEDLNLKPVYSLIISSFYNSSVSKVKFSDTVETSDVINNFVNEKTNGVIPKAIDADSIDPLTKMVIINAIYYKGDWLVQFDEAETSPMTFHVDGETSVEHPFGMRLTADLRMANIEELGASVLELPYKNDFFRMLIILPDADKDIRYVERRLGLLEVKGIDERLDEQSFNAEVEILLPRFDVTFEWTDLAGNLKSLGVEALFNAEKANLTNISDDPLYVSKIAHKAVLKVNEEGTEAAGFTGVVIGTRNSGPKTKREFKADRPFIFYIYDHQNNVPHFVGRLVDPTGASKLKPVEPIIQKAAASVNCNEEGFDTSGAAEDAVSLPCNGQDTFNVREHDGERQKIHFIGQ